MCDLGGAELRAVVTRSHRSGGARARSRPQRHEARLGEDDGEAAASIAS